MQGTSIRFEVAFFFHSESSPWALVGSWKSLDWLWTTSWSIPYLSWCLWCCRSSCGDTNDWFFLVCLCELDVVEVMFSYKTFIVQWRSRFLILKQIWINTALVWVSSSNGASFFTWSPYIKEIHSSFLLFPCLFYPLLWWWCLCSFVFYLSLGYLLFLS